MNAREKTLLSAALVLSLAGAAYWGLNRPTQESKSVTTKPGPTPFGEVPRIAKLAAVDESEYNGDTLFTNRRIPIIPQSTPENVGIRTIMGVVIPVPPIPPLPPPPPPGPTLPVRDNIIDVPLIYSGFARDDSGELTAFIETNGQGNVPAGHYNLKEDDYLIGRLRVTKITPEAVEVEDMDRAESAAKRKQAIGIRK